jgi:hypothetical protein
MPVLSYHMHAKTVQFTVAKQSFSSKFESTAHSTKEEGERHVKNIYALFVGFTILAVSTACTEINFIEKRDASVAGSGGSSGDEGCAGDSGEGGSDGGSAGAGGSMAGGGGSSGDGAGGSSGSSGSGGDAGSGGSGGDTCVQALQVERVSHETSLVPAGTQNLVTFTFHMLATCDDLDIRTMTFTLTAPDYSEKDTTPFLHGDMKDPNAWNLNDIRVMDAESGAVIMGPAIPKVSVNGRVVAHFWDVFTLTGGKTRTVTLTLDVPSTFPFLEAVRYGVDLQSVEYKDADAIPLSVSTADGYPSTPVFTVTPAPTEPLKVRMVHDLGGKLASPSYSVPLVRYEVVNAGSAPRVSKRIGLQQTHEDGDWRDFESVFVRDMADGSVIFAADIPSGIPSDGVIVMDTSRQPVVPALGKMEVEVNGRMAAPVASATVNNAWKGVPRSGHRPVIHIVELVDDQNQQATIEPHVVRPVVLRKSQPMMTFVPAADTVLRNGTMDLLQFRMNAFQVESIGVKQIRFPMTSTSGYLSNARLLRGATECPQEECRVIVAVDQRMVTVVFSNEMVLVPSSMAFTLRAEVNGVIIPNSMLQIGFGQEGLGTVITSKPLLQADGTFWLAGEARQKTLLWSDRSEVPHSEMSLDWTDGWGVMMEGANTFIAP